VATINKTNGEKTMNKIFKPRMILTDVETNTLRRLVPGCIEARNTLGKACYLGALGSQRLTPPKSTGFRSRAAALVAVQREIDHELKNRGIIRVGIDVLGETSRG
jgi:hypothetical protein